MFLFLDDDRTPDQVTWVNDVRYTNSHWNVVKSYDEFVSFIEEFGIPSLVSFDHDLADEHYEAVHLDRDLPYEKYSEKTGVSCARWLLNYCVEKNMKFPEYLVHSMNPIGKYNIEQEIESYMRHFDI